MDNYHCLLTGFKFLRRLLSNTTSWYAPGMPTDWVAEREQAKEHLIMERHLSPICPAKWLRHLLELVQTCMQQSEAKSCAPCIPITSVCWTVSSTYIQPQTKQCKHVAEQYIMIRLSDAVPPSDCMLVGLLWYVNRQIGRCYRNNSCREWFKLPLSTMLFWGDMTAKTCIMDLKSLKQLFTVFFLHLCIYCHRKT